MKRRINITVQPVDNGYTITANSQPIGGRGTNITANVIAKDEQEVKDAVTKFMGEAFVKDEPAAPSAA